MDVVLPLHVRCSSVLFVCSHSYFRPGVFEELPSLCSLPTAIPSVLLRRVVLAALAPRMVSPITAESVTK